MTEMDEELDAAYFKGKKEGRSEGFRSGYTTAVIDIESERNKGRRALRTAARLFSVTVGLASQVFMGNVFYNEFFLRRGVLYVEPNLAICGGELATVIAGIAATVWAFWRSTD